MKIRTCHVSNSSSTSFVVINFDGVAAGIAKARNIYGDRYSLELNKNSGTTQFGWGPATINDFLSKVIFSWLQAVYLYKTKPQYLKMLAEVLKSTLNVEELYFNLTTEYDLANEEIALAYIDHQSSSTEGKNMEIFTSEEYLKAFLFSNKSHIVLDSDNY